MNDLVGAPSTVAGALQRTVADEDPAIAVTPAGVCTVAAVALVAASQVSNTAAAKQSGARWTLSLGLRPPSAITPRPADTHESPVQTFTFLRPRLIYL